MSADLLTYQQAADVVANHASVLAKSLPAIERVCIAEVGGRVLASPIAADADQPPFARSTRDGFACRAAEASAHLVVPVTGSTRAGEAPPASLPPGQAWEIMTGAAVPDGADCVVMLEHVEHVGHAIRLAPSRLIEPGENIVARGAQSHRGEELLKPSTRLGPAQIALAASCGYAQIDVYARPRVAILTTGDELVAVDACPGPGQIRNSNASMLAALVADAGGEPLTMPAAADTEHAIDAALAEAGEADMLLISGGVSAGKFDLVEPALARRGAKFHFTGVRIQPGKPLVFGQISRAHKRALYFFGLPGNPISSAATFQLFARQVLSGLAGSGEVQPRFVLAELSRPTDRKGKKGLTRFLPGRCEFSSSIEKVPLVSTVPWQGSGDLTAFAQSNCFVVIPDDKDYLEAGTAVHILLH